MVCKRYQDLDPRVTRLWGPELFALGCMNVQCDAHLVVGPVAALFDSSEIRPCSLIAIGTRGLLVVLYIADIVPRNGVPLLDGACSTSLTQVCSATFSGSLAPSGAYSPCPCDNDLDRLSKNVVCRQFASHTKNLTAVRFRSWEFESPSFAFSGSRVSSCSLTRAWNRNSNANTARLNGEALPHREVF